jgi:2-methylcitrate dehydratase PrpD
MKAMNDTIIEQLARFAHETDVDRLPAEVVEESKRVVLDSLGCALGGVTEPKGRIGIGYAAIIGGDANNATVIGTPYRSSVVGAAFANGELVSALDFDAILPPGHVSPYVLPGALAVGEDAAATGRAVLAAVAVSHEMSYRFGKSMDYTRDTRDGQMQFAAVLGYTSTIFGATAAIAMLRRASPAQMANGLGIAGAISPVNSHRAWMSHAPSATIKYTMAGMLAQQALTAAHMGLLGHRGDLQLLDDRELGYPRFIGTQRWEPSNLIDGLGDEWRFPAESTFKPYPHCRVMHGLFDGLIDLVEEHDILPHEIEELRAWGEAWIMQPVWENKRIGHVQDAQFSVDHGLAVAAHRIPPGRAWQHPDVVFSPSVLRLMERCTFAPHPEFVSAINAHPASRPSRIELVARGQVFRADRTFPKGSPSPDPETRMTNEELAAKFHVNAEGVISRSQADAVINDVLELEKIDDLGSVMGALGVVASQ